MLVNIVVSILCTWTWRGMYLRIRMKIDKIKYRTGNVYSTLYYNIMYLQQDKNETTCFMWRQADLNIGRCTHVFDNMCHITHIIFQYIFICYDFNNKIVYPVVRLLTPYATYNTIYIVFIMVCYGLLFFIYIILTFMRTRAAV